jgi:hypothetical protein
MNRKLAIFAAVIAAFAFTCQGADAGGRREIDPRITGVAIGVGAASTATYFAINNWRWNGWNNSSGLTSFGAWGATTIGCAALSPIVATVVLNRPLSIREAHILVGSCVVPIVGGWLVNEAYNANPQWEPGYKPHRHGKKKRHAKM